MRLLLLFLTVLGSIPISGCDQEYVRDVGATKCLTSGLPTPMQQAILGDDADSLGESIEELKDDQQMRVIEALREFWTCDASRHPPNESPGHLRLRIRIATVLAQAVRNRSIQYPLEEFQRIALERVVGAESLRDKLEALNLVGISNSSQQVGWLEEIIQTNKQSPGFQSEAIRALGYICSTEAEATLRKLRDDRLVETVHSRAILETMALREELRSSWCRYETEPSRP